jgi:hypothetical protein
METNLFFLKYICRNEGAGLPLLKCIYYCKERFQTVPYNNKKEQK